MWSFRLQEGVVIHAVVVGMYVCIWPFTWYTDPDSSGGSGIGGGGGILNGARGH